MARIVASGVTTVVPSAAGMLAQFVGSLALLAIMVPQIAWMLIPAGIVFTGFTLGFRRVLKRLHKRIAKPMDAHVPILSSALTACLS